jgi:1-acyl-sn-glycerol-3-phosphate acyltransferase
VLPVAHNAGCFWGRRAFIKEPGVVRVVIGTPLSGEGLTAATLNARAEAWITKTTEILEKAEGACREKIPATQ